MKKAIFLFIFLTILNSLFSQAILKNNPTFYKNENKSVFRKLSKFEITRILYWSTWGATGFTALINTFGHLGNAYIISNDMKSFANEIENDDGDMSIFLRFTDSYPVIVFGINFITSGLAFIPVAGGIAYGTALYCTAIIFSAIRVSPPLFDITVDYSSNSSISTRLQDFHYRMFDPTAYFVVGTISILLGVGEIITNAFYNREKRRKKYPYIQKIFSFTPTSITIKLDV